MSDSSDSTFYEIEKIVNIRKKNNKIYLLIKWKGYDSSNNTWEPNENLNPISAIEQLEELQEDFKNESQIKKEYINSAINIWKKKLNLPNLITEKEKRKNQKNLEEKRKLKSEKNLKNKLVKIQNNVKLNSNTSNLIKSISLQKTYNVRYSS